MNGIVDADGRALLAIEISRNDSAPTYLELQALPKMPHELHARVLAIALRSPRRGPMREVDAAETTVDQGLAGDGHVSPERGVTLLSRERWAEALAELGVELPWHTRRANVLVEGIDLAAAIGQELQIGEVVLRIEGETDPCGVMDRAHYGLRQALAPHCRGGVHGRVIRAGRMAVGDAIVCHSG